MSRAQRPHPVLSSWDGTKLTDFHEARSARVPDGLPSCGICEGSGEWHCNACGGDFCGGDFCGNCIAFAHHDCPAHAGETRECEGCGQQKPIEEMSTVFLPGTGESYQCEQCRGAP